jgi:FtsZ-binding cell division protein ZapB
MKTIDESVQERRRKLKEHLKNVSEEVNKWPEWQRNLLGDLGDLSSDRASFRNPVEK